MPGRLEAAAEAVTDAASDVMDDLTRTPSALATGDPGIVPPARIEVVVDEPPAPRRVRRPIDLVRAVLALIGCIAVCLIAVVATATTSGIESDLEEAAGGLPAIFLALADLVSTLAILSLPVALGIDQVLRGRGRDYVHAVGAAGVTVLLAGGVNWWASSRPRGDLVIALTRPAAEGGYTTMVNPFLAGIVALISVLSLSGRGRWQLVAWGSVTLSAVTFLLAEYTTPWGLLLSLAIGRLVGTSTRYALGSPNLRPNGLEVAQALARAHLMPARIRLADAAAGEARVYVADLTDGQHLEVEVFDQDRQGAGLLSRTWRAIRLREAVARRTPLSLRQAVDHEALMAYAATQAGMDTPRLLAVTEVGPDAALIAYEATAGRPLASMPTQDVTDAHLNEAWRQLRLLHRKGAAHRALSATNILLEGRQRVVVRGLAQGEVAASDLQLRLDSAELLVTLALTVGPDRAVHSALDMVGEAEVAATLPLLQPIPLSPETRRALKSQPDMLGELRERVVGLTPAVETPPVDLERLKPRTVVSLVAGVIALYFLLSQLGSVDLVEIVTSADWRWAAVAVVFAAMTYVAAAMILQGFVPLRLPFVRTVLAQVAASFASLVAPAAVGGYALNTRFVQRAGVPASVAVASVGVSQVAAFAIHLVLLAVFGVITGTGTGEEFVPSQNVLWIVGVILALTVVAFLIAPVRRLAVARLRPTLSTVVPRLLDVLQTPSRLILGLAGNLLLNLGKISALWVSIRAFDDSLAFSTVAVVYLAGTALGAAAPTPGGLGAIEAALAAGLTAAGLPGSVAVSSVLLFRTATFWLPVLPGYVAFNWLQRKGAL